jgi:hypothetical protein
MSKPHPTELFYDPMGAYKNGVNSHRSIGGHGNHGNHVHVAY